MNLNIFKRRNAMTVVGREDNQDTMVKIDTSTEKNFPCPCGNPDCPGLQVVEMPMSALREGVYMGNIFDPESFIVKALEAERPNFLNELRERIENTRNVNVTVNTLKASDVIAEAVANTAMNGSSGEAAVPTDTMVDPGSFSVEELESQIAYHEGCLAECRERLEALAVPEDVSDIFACMADDEDYSVIGDPVEYERTEDQLVALARVLYKGEPFTVIGRATEGDMVEYEKHFVYIHLDDDFSFSLGNAIYAARA